MATSYSPKVNTDGLIMCVDFANPKSYPSGSTVITDIARRVTGSLSVFTPYRVDSGRGVHFTQGQNVQINTDHNALTNATFIAWINLPSSSINANRVFWGTGEAPGGNVYGFQSVGVDISGSLYASNGKGGNGPDPRVSSSLAINDGNWHMVTFQYSVGDKLYLYVDNQKNIGPSFPSKGQQSTSSYIAGDYNGGNNAISGSIGTVMWYNRILTDVEVLQNYNAMRGRFGV